MTTSANDAQENVHKSVRGFVGDVDRTFLRPLERSMHLCAANCCEDTATSTEKVHACIEQCQGQTVKAHGYMQAEMQRFQVRKKKGKKGRQKKCTARETRAALNLSVTPHAKI
jgi:hypothetical protein